MRLVLCVSLWYKWREKLHVRRQLLSIRRHSVCCRQSTKRPSPVPDVILSKERARIWNTCIQTIIKRRHRNFHELCISDGRDGQIGTTLILLLIMAMKFKKKFEEKYDKHCIRLADICIFFKSYNIYFFNFKAWYLLIFF